MCDSGFPAHEGMDRIRESRAFEGLAEIDAEDRERMERPQELFARAYAQWIALAFRRPAHARPGR